MQTSFLSAGRRGVLGLILCWAIPLSSGALLSQEAPPHTTKTELHFPRPIPLSELIGATVADSQNQTCGTITDALVDPLANYVPVLLIRPEGRLDANLVVPLRVGELQTSRNSRVWLLKSPDAATVKETTAQPGQQSVSASQVRTWLQNFGQPIPWKEDAAAPPHLKFHSLRDLLGQDVTGESSRPLGQITDFILSPTTGRIAYTILQRTPADKTGETGGSARALVPLSAYVTTDKPRTWALMLPVQELQTSGELKGETLPDHMPRGWIEYVHVRYGGDIAGGIQPARHKAP